MTVVSMFPAPQFKVGDDVEVQHTVGRWIPATVQRVRHDMYYAESVEGTHSYHHTNVRTASPVFSPGDVVEFDHGKETFLMREGWHTGVVVSVHDHAVIVRLQTKHGGPMNLPVRDSRLRHSPGAPNVELPDEDAQPLGEVPNVEDYARKASESVTRSVTETVAKYGRVSEGDFAGLADCHQLETNTIYRPNGEGSGTARDPYIAVPHFPVVEEGVSIQNNFLSHPATPPNMDRLEALRTAQELYPNADHYTHMLVANYILHEDPALT